MERNAKILMQVYHANTLISTMHRVKLHTFARKKPAGPTRRSWRAKGEACRPLEKRRRKNVQLTGGCPQAEGKRHSMQQHFPGNSSGPEGPERRKK
jgi:hypothetical protein